MKNSLFRFILKVHKKLPFVPFEKKLIKFYHNFQDKKGTVEVNMGGINYKLDLNELIDNKVFYGNWEHETTSIFKRMIKPGMVVLDVGANMGYYTLLAAKLTGGIGRVIAFEPTSGGLKRLKKNILLNNFKNIIIENVGLSNENKKIKSKIRHSWKRSGLVEPKEDIMEMIKLDDYIEKNDIDNIDFIKVDVDGYEYQFLKGAKKTLQRYKPVLCMEISNYEKGGNGGHLEDYGISKGYSLKEIYSLLKSLDYNFYYENGSPISFEEMNERIIINKGCENFLLINKFNKKLFK